MRSSLLLLVGLMALAPVLARADSLQCEIDENGARPRTFRLSARRESGDNPQFLSLKLLSGGRRGEKTICHLGANGIGGLDIGVEKGGQVVVYYQPAWFREREMHQAGGTATPLVVGAVTSSDEIRLEQGVTLKVLWRVRNGPITNLISDHPNSYDVETWLGTGFVRRPFSGQPAKDSDLSPPR
jgi:hypothetical protein